MKKITNTHLLITVLLVINLLFVIFIQKSLYPIHLVPQNFFISDLVGKIIYLPSVLIYLFELGNLILLWLIAKKFYNGYFALIPPAIYAISPWNSYLTATGSFYIFLLFIILIVTYSLLLIKENKNLPGVILLTVSSVIAVYSSFFFLVLIPMIIGLIIILKFIPLKNLKVPIILTVLLITPLLFTIYKNHLSFKNIAQNQIRIFADPGLINTANSFQGEAREENFGTLARISENKYFFMGEYLLLKLSQQVAPTTSFTSQEMLLNFSFSSPIFLGFLIPFFYGIYILLKSDSARKIIFISGLLMFPSVLAKQPVDLNRLVIFMPIIVFIISYGIVKLIEQKNKKMVYIVIFSVLVFLQVLITVSDIKLREKDRFIQYFGQNYEVKEQ
ncbi:MAG: hypothetical protein ABSE04_00165 [Candidatus Microgenomates bacterium]|jgi:hypothetical protein